MIESKVVSNNGRVHLTIDGKKIPEIAYITYFDERNDYEKFSKLGFKMFSVNVSFAMQPINTLSGFIPFTKGVFDNKEKTDFSAIDDVISLVLNKCPDALIFPRIYVTMPKWWLDENEAETVDVPRGKKREMLFSEKFRKDACVMLEQIIRYIESRDYCDNIIGYQISGGNTQEWFHFDENGSYCENALPFFNKYLESKGFDTTDHLPSLDGMSSDGIIEDVLVTQYIRFANEGVADTVEALCKTAKNACEMKKIVGVFYGYTLEVTNPLRGTHAITKLIDSKYIDFFSSPNSYNKSRPLGIDWADMMPTESIKLHGKMCFIECDIRTHLTKCPEDSRKGSDSERYYSNAVWKGPENEELSVSAVRKTLCHHITKGNAIWWFDMFGHWYDSELLMREMKLSYDLYSSDVSSSQDSCCKTCVIIDEKMYSLIGKRHPLFQSLFNERIALGECGAPFDIYLAEDTKKIKDRYKAFIIIIPKESQMYTSTLECIKDKPHLLYTNNKNSYTSDKIREFLKTSGVFIYCNSNDTAYIGNGFAAIHAKDEGTKVIDLPKASYVTDIISNECYQTDKIVVNMKKHETKIFKTK